MARPTLFLIDGSNQMYRAYHAIRGLAGLAADPRCIMLRDDAAQADYDHRPDASPHVRSADRDIRAKLASYKANRAQCPTI
jgi:hypothetical protein